VDEIAARRVGYQVYLKERKERPEQGDTVFYCYKGQRPDPSAQSVPVQKPNPSQAVPQPSPKPTWRETRDWQEVLRLPKEEFKQVGLMCRCGGESRGYGSTNDFSECPLWEFKKRIMEEVVKQGGPSDRFVFEKAQRKNQKSQWPQMTRATADQTKVGSTYIRMKV
jgi:hypothetical protein